MNYKKQRIERSRKVRGVRHCEAMARLNLKVTEDETQEYLLAIFKGAAEAPDGYELVQYGKYPSLKNEQGITIADFVHGHVFLTVSTSVLDIEHLCYHAEMFYNK